MLECRAFLSAGAVGDLASELRGKSSGIGKPEDALLDGAYNKAFCRSCRLYKCLVHRHASVRYLLLPAL